MGLEREEGHFFAEKNWYFKLKKNSTKHSSWRRSEFCLLKRVLYCFYFELQGAGHIIS